MYCSYKTIFTLLFLLSLRAVPMQGVLMDSYQSMFVQQLLVYTAPH